LRRLLGNKTPIRVCGSSACGGAEKVISKSKKEYRCVYIAMFTPAKPE
jgi:hypothetical protein